MKKLFAAAALAIAMSAGAAGASTVHHNSIAASHATLVCPVTGNKIASIKAAAGHSTYKGKTYYFCCPMCKPQFDKNPQKFLNNAAHGKYAKM